MQAIATVVWRLNFRLLFVPPSLAKSSPSSRTLAPCYLIYKVQRENHLIELGVDTWVSSMMLKQESKRPAVTSRMIFCISL
jgi:hypothetical protein